jgi:hypothetical protein
MTALSIVVLFAYRTALVPVRTEQPVLGDELDVVIDEAPELAAA